MFRSVCLLAVLLLSISWDRCAAQPRIDQLLAGDAEQESDDADNADYVQRLEQFVDQYRNLIAKSILRLQGACVAYDRLAATSGRNWYAAGDRLAGNTGTTVDIEQYILTVLRQLQTESPAQIAATFARQNSTEPGVNVLFYIVTTSNMLKDAQLDVLLAAMLFDQCCTLGDGDGGTAGAAGRCDPAVRKRQPQPQKKQRFHAWGGKRSRVGAPLGSGGNVPAQVVIRAPFHSWGGRKRSVDDEVAN